MSRRKPPTDPMPEEYSDVIIKDEEVQQLIIQRSQPIEIPSATLHGNKNNLKNIKSFKKLRQTYKVSNQKTVFVTDMKNMLDHLDVGDNKFNLELLVEVSNIANEFFIYGESESRESTKIEAVHELLLPYFQGDSDILELMLVSVQKTIRKSTMFKRGIKRLYNFFCLIGKA